MSALSFFHCELVGCAFQHDATFTKRQEPPSPSFLLFSSDMEQQLSLLKERGNSAFRAENFQEALSFYSTYLTLKRDGVIHSNRSLVLLKLGDNEGSLREAEEAILLRPDFVKGFVRKAVALVALGRIEEARDAYTAGLEVCIFHLFCWCIISVIFLLVTNSLTHNQID